jgi:hypothetical protein
VEQQAHQWSWAISASKFKNTFQSGFLSILLAKMAIKTHYFMLD